MFRQRYRLTSKDVRYIQKQRNLIWTQHFGFLWIKQYPNRHYHQLSMYIPADTVKKAVWRHQLKRKLLATLPLPKIPLSTKSGSQFFKIFIFLNKKNISPLVFSQSPQERTEAINSLTNHFLKEWHICQQKLSH